MLYFSSIPPVVLALTLVGEAEATAALVHGPGIARTVPAHRDVGPGLARAAVPRVAPTVPSANTALALDLALDRVLSLARGRPQSRKSPRRSATGVLVVLVPAPGLGLALDPSRAPPPDLPLRPRARVLVVTLLRSPTITMQTCVPGAPLPPKNSRTTSSPLCASAWNPDIHGGNSLFTL